MKDFLIFLLEVTLGTPRELYRYIRNEHRDALSKKLQEALKKESEVIVYFRAGGYRWSIRRKLVRELRSIGVTRMKEMHDQYDAVIAALTPWQVAKMSTKRWLSGMCLVSEALAMEEASVRDDLNTHKRFDQTQIIQSLQALHEKYQL